MNRGLGETLIMIGLMFCLFAFVLSLIGCTNIDVNGYRAPAAKPGQPIHCKGACP